MGTSRGIDGNQFWHFKTGEIPLTLGHRTITQLAQNKRERDTLPLPYMVGMGSGAPDESKRIGIDLGSNKQCEKHGTPDLLSCKRNCKKTLGLERIFSCRQSKPNTDLLGMKWKQ